MKQNRKRLTALVSALALCIALGVGAFAAELQPRAQVCPSCGSGSLRVTQVYGTVNTTGQSRACQHGHAQYNDVSAHREISNHYVCPNCGLDETFGTGTYQEGWKCNYNRTFYPN